MTSKISASTDRLWADYDFGDEDLESIYNLLLERESPLTTAEILSALVDERLTRLEAERLERPGSDVPVYLPLEAFEEGQRILFPALGGAIGQVVGKRAGDNPGLGPFDVIQVQFETGAPTREFASRLADHPLNAPPDESQDDLEGSLADGVLRQFGVALTQKLDARLKQTPDIVRIAGRWFPRQLLVDVGVGHLNLAEAVLDVAGGGPLPTSELIPHLALPEDVNPVLAEFSVDYALQEDDRFDEVGPAGMVLWHLHRLEPAEVRRCPERLEPGLANLTRDWNLSDESEKLCERLDDELSDLKMDLGAADEVRLGLLFPHWRVGSLPLSRRLRALFPTAYEAPRIRFILVDGHSGECFPGWVVRAERYVYGLEAFYRRYEVPVGGWVVVRRGDAAGEVVVEAVDRRRRTEWIRTATVSDEGVIGFSMLKQSIGTAFDDQLIVGVHDLEALDRAWAGGGQRKMPLDRLVTGLFRDLAKLNPQSAVHAQALHAAINVIQRLPPEPILAELEARAYFVHVGDDYWRFDEGAWSAR